MSRLEALRELVEQGQPVDLGRVKVLQSLDAAIADEQFATEAARRQQEADDAIRGYAN